jgi:hypothetical protein
MDFTAVKGLGSLSHSLRARGQRIVFVNVCPNVCRILRGFEHGEEDANRMEIYETTEEWIRAGEIFFVNLFLLQLIYDFEGSSPSSRIRPSMNDLLNHRGFFQV